MILPLLLWLGLPLLIVHSFLCLCVLMDALCIAENEADKHTPVV